MRKSSFFHRVVSALVSLVMLTALSSAFAAGEATTGHAVYWTGSVVVEGHEALFAQNGQSYEPINYNGNVYVPLFAVGEWTASNASWDPQAKTIAVHYNALRPTHYRSAGEMPGRTDAQFDQWLETVTAGRTTGFTVTVLTDTAVTGDQGRVSTTTPQGAVLYPIVHENVPYLSLRTVAQLSGKTLCYFNELSKRPRPTVYLYETPSQEQIQTARSYLDEVDARIGAVDGHLPTLAQAGTVQELHDRLVELKTLLLRIKDPSIPSIPTLTQEVLTGLYSYGIDGDSGLRALDPDIAWSGGLTSESKDLWRVRDLHVNNVHVLAETMSNTTLRMHQILESMAAGELRD